MILPVILAGGAGTRLWPLSRSNYPKQLLTLGDEQHTMLQLTLLRLTGLNALPPLIICNEEHRFAVAEQVRHLGIEHSGILLEPEGRNTAPTVTLAALKAGEHGSETVLLVLAADHSIKNESEFCKAVNVAIEFAESDKIVTFGIVPKTPETGYGYIKCGDAIKSRGEANSYRVNRFVEKPDRALAKNFLVTGGYFWNSGIFMFQANRYLTVLEKYNLDIYQACKLAMIEQTTDMDFTRIGEAAFLACPSNSIDYSIMEPLCKDGDNVVMVPMDAEWSDVGGFEALSQLAVQDENGNVVQGDVWTVGAKNSYIHTDDTLVAAVGLENVIVINTKDALLVAAKEKLQDVKTLVGQLQKEGRRETAYHKEVYRPWGKYDVVDKGERFLVKRITVNPGCRLSLQLHRHRAEHWVVVSGIATVINGDEQFTLVENQSTYIPIGVKHSLQNNDSEPLLIIETQTGHYLGEDDIIRFD